MLVSPFRARGGSILVAFFFIAIVFYVFVSRKLKHQPLPVPKTYLPTPTANLPVEENFPFAAQATSSADVPPIPSFNRMKAGEATSSDVPLLIGFTRNWPILQQAVVSYITAGWPPNQIYVLENTGTMDANKRNQLSLQNPFYLDHKRLTDVFGINVVRTPTLLSFAQLQNFMMHLAIEKSWPNYFWSHMDVAVLSDEKFTVPDDDDNSRGKYLTFYQRALAKRAELMGWENSGADVEAQGQETNGKWALSFFCYDLLTLVNLKAYVEVGGWDSMIGYYMGDCDFYERIHMAKYRVDDANIGLVADVGTSLPDLGAFYRRKGWDSNGTSRAGNHVETHNSMGPTDFGVEDERGGAGYDRLHESIIDLSHKKLGSGPGMRNFWQSQQQGGQGEPFYRDSSGFERGLWMMIESGRKIFSEKWGHRDCDIVAQGLEPGDAWRMAHDWD